MIDPELIEAFRFFSRHGGMWVGHNAESALALARAERRAKAEGLTFTWEEDDDPDLSWMPERERTAPHTVLGCVARPPGERTHLASMWGVVDPDRDYRRVVEAEIAQEALENLDAERARPCCVTCHRVL